MKLEDFNYHLPKERIAQETIEPRDHCKLMVLKNDQIYHKKFYNIIDYLEKDDVLVINETKVSRAKLVGKKTSGGLVEIMLVKKINEKTFECRIKGRARLNAICQFKNNLECRITDKKEDIFTIEFNRTITKEEEKNFELPLPPYIKEKIKDENDYQTIYSNKEGSLAAPTAGLHFTEKLLKRIEAKGIIITKVCLHVGFGTFLPIRTDTVEDHKMHSEEYEITSETAKIINERKGRLFIVGTTSMRTLESANENGKVIARKGSTEIFIYPGYKFKNDIYGMITNFHLPKSTLLLLVSAFYGKETMLKAYDEAIKQEYRFFSLGDSMFLLK